MTKIKNVWFDSKRIFVEMEDQRVFGNPIEWYPNLRKGTSKQMEKFIIKGDGRWIHWPELDEDLDAECFLDYVPNSKVQIPNHQASFNFLYGNCLVQFVLPYSSSAKFA